MTGLSSAWLGLAAMAVLWPAMVTAALFPAKSPVVQLSHSSFQREVLDIEKPTLVAFTAPWCGHCKNLAPEFHKAAVHLDGIVKFANIDCDADVNRGTCAQYQIQGFPTIKLFPATKRRLPRDYRGERKAKAMVEFAKDTLPMGARKLGATDLSGWLNEGPHRPKVILFTTKSKSSPLYRSLALDYRKTMDFAFMRGDEGLVRSQGRLVLGVDIPTEASLPVLLIVPGRDTDTEVEKGMFDTYAGPLQYHKIKAWLDEVGPKMGVGKKAKPAKKVKKDKPDLDDTIEAARRFIKNEGHVDKAQGNEEVIPDGGFVEWKAQKPLVEKAKKKAKKAKEAVEEVLTPSQHDDDEALIDHSGPHKDSWEGKMKIIEEAGAVADRLRAETLAEAENTRKFAGLFSPSAGEDGEDASLLDKVKSAAASVVDAAADVYNDASQVVLDAAKGAQEGLQDVADKAMQGTPFARKNAALMKQFEKWMAGEAPSDWENMLGKEYARAQAEAEELLRKDPEEAARQAWKSEEWLLGQMQSDRKRMYDVMTTEQRAQVDNMIELIESRLARKDRMDPFAKDDEAQFPFTEDAVLKPADHMAGSAKKASHDEL